MYTRMLVPLDGSELAEQVVPYVRILAKGLQARIELLQVFEPVSPWLADPDHAVYLDQIATSRRGLAQDYLKRVALPLREEGGTVSFTVHEGSPAECIVEEMEKGPPTLLAMCTHGRSGVTRWVLGSTTEKVLHAISHPILVVRARAREASEAEIKPETVIVPLDGSILAEQVLPHAIALAKGLRLNVILVRVTPTAKEYALRYVEFAGYPFTYVQDLARRVAVQALEYLDRIREKLLQQGVSSVDGRLLHGDAPSAIIDMARQVQASLVAMTTHGDSGIDRWIRGSVTDKVVRHSEQPLLVIRAIKEAAQEG